MNIKESDIEQLEIHLIDAIRESDISFLENIMHDSLIGIAPNGEIITKELDLAAHRSGNMTVHELIPEIEKIQIIEDIAIAIVTYYTKGEMFGNPVEGKFKYNRIWKKYDNGFKIISVSCMKTQ